METARKKGDMMDEFELLKERIHDEALDTELRRLRWRKESPASKNTFQYMDMTCHKVCKHKSRL